jgi:hypothetical protein
MIRDKITENTAMKECAESYKKRTNLMVFLQTFEKFNTPATQPFYLTKSDRLWIRDDLVRDYIFNYSNPKFQPKFGDKRITADFSATDGHHKYDIVFQALVSKTNWVRDENGKINHKIKPTYHLQTKETPAGNYTYYVWGRCGDFDLGQGYKTVGIRRTRKALENVMEKIYPIFSKIKNGYKRLKEGDFFYDLIEQELIKNPRLVLELANGYQDKQIQEWKHTFNYQKIKGVNRVGII